MHFSLDATTMNEMIFIILKFWHMPSKMMGMRFLWFSLRSQDLDGFTALSSFSWLGSYSTNSAVATGHPSPSPHIPGMSGSWSGQHRTFVPQAYPFLSACFLQTFLLFSYQSCLSVCRFGECIVLEDPFVLLISLSAWALNGSHLETPRFTSAGKSLVPKGCLASCAK